MVLISSCPLVLPVSSQMGKLLLGLTHVLEINMFSHSIYMQNPLRLLSWKENKTAEDEKLTYYNIMNITHLEGTHLVRKVFFPLLSIFLDFLPW